MHEDDIPPFNQSRHSKVVLILFPKPVPHYTLGLALLHRPKPPLNAHEDFLLARPALDRDVPDALHARIPRAVDADAARGIPPHVAARPHAPRERRARRLIRIGAIGQQQLLRVRRVEVEQVVGRRQDGRAGWLRQRDALRHPALRDEGCQRDVESVRVQRRYVIVQDDLGTRRKLGLEVVVVRGGRLSSDACRVAREYPQLLAAIAADCSRQHLK